MIDPRKFEALFKSPDFKRYLAEVALAVTGELDAEYKRVAGLIAEWDKRNNLVQQAAALQQGQAALANQTAAANKGHAERTSKLQTWEDGLKKREEELAAKIKYHLQASEELSAAQGVHASTSQATKQAFDQREKAIAQKEKDLENFQSALHQRDLALSQKEAKVQNALSTLNVALR